MVVLNGIIKSNAKYLIMKIAASFLKNNNNNNNWPGVLGSRDLWGPRGSSSGVPSNVRSSPASRTKRYQSV